MKRVPVWLLLALVLLGCGAVGAFLARQYGIHEPDNYALLLSNLALCAIVLLAYSEMQGALKRVGKRVDGILESSSEKHAATRNALEEHAQQVKASVQTDAQKLLDAVKAISTEVTSVQRQVQELRDHISRTCSIAANRAGAATAPAHEPQTKTFPLTGERPPTETIWDLGQAIELWKQKGAPTDTRLFAQAKALKHLEERLSGREHPSDDLLNQVCRYLYGVGLEPEPESLYHGVDEGLVWRLGGAVTATRVRLLRQFESHYRLRLVPTIESLTEYNPKLHEREADLDVPTNNPEKNGKVARVHRHAFVHTESGDVFRRAVVSVYQLKDQAQATSGESPAGWGDEMWDRLAQDVAVALQCEPSSAQRRDLVARMAQLGLDWQDVQISNAANTWVSGTELESLPASFAEGLRMAGVRWRGQLKVSPRTAE